jgi:Lar family restriction alleviation protein
MSDDLKPCPFCGAVPLPVNTNGSYVFCGECGADGPVHLTEAIAAWNTRAKPLADRLFDQQIADYVKRGKP